MLRYVNPYAIVWVAQRMKKDEAEMYSEIIIPYREKFIITYDKLNEEVIFVYPKQYHYLISDLERKDLVEGLAILPKDSLDIIVKRLSEIKTLKYIGSVRFKIQGKVVSKKYFFIETGEGRYLRAEL